ncbi:hypothetical protein ACP70R_044074 [Stipagrostis hirtigluma subsp. patula]
MAPSSRRRDVCSSSGSPRPLARGMSPAVDFLVGPLRVPAGLAVCVLARDADAAGLHRRAARLPRTSTRSSCTTQRAPLRPPRPLVGACLWQTRRRRRSR